ncbi:MAG: hypothetical protein PHT31_00400 [Candidatus Omnitrophica bacterium]|nr:hypothetical protein [Candidatus Omnitrophota bacterium]MDD5652606.1 hypothetical protein [Candidatus Omnitrophota bacterium]
MKLKKIPLPFAADKAVLGFGAQTKNTLCFARGRAAFLATAHNDLSDPDDLTVFEKEARYFLRQKPKIIAYDLHPDYQSSKFALSLGRGSYSFFAVQHHHAHIAACMAENGLTNRKIIGVAFDGTGLGSDNSIWGSEFLICNYGNYQRKAHLKEIPLLGGEKAVLEPWRLVCAWDNCAVLPAQYQKQCRILRKLMQQRLNTPSASSMGRLFDAAGCLILKKYQVAEEAELPIELERAASCYAGKAAEYKFTIQKKQGQYIIDPTAIFRQILEDLEKRKPKDEIAFRFHCTIAQMIAKTCLKLRKESEIDQVALSGGVFQNKLLLGLTLELLCKLKFKAITHQSLSSSDVSISLGQVAVAAHSRE